MSSRWKKLLMTALVFMGIYALTPFAAGLLNTYDRRGPTLFFESHHELLYTFGYYMAGHHRHDGKPRVPPRERSWFYGIEGERLPEQQIREKLEALSQQR